MPGTIMPPFRSDPQVATFKPQPRSSGEKSVCPSDTDSRGKTALPKVLFAAIITMGLGMALVQSQTREPDPDEYEHLHAAWLWSQGLQPYTGFFEHHPPLFWRLLRPVVSGADRSHLMSLILTTRSIAWLVVAATVVGSWWLFSVLFGRQAAWAATALLAWYCGASPTVIHIRPDVPSLLLVVAGTAAALSGLGLAGRSRRPSWLLSLVAGGLIGAAVCMLTKAVFWAAMLLACLLVWTVIDARGTRPGGAGGQAGSRRRWLALAMLAAGVAAAGAAQLAWIFAANDFNAFWQDNVQINRAMAGSVLRNMPTAARFWAQGLAWPMISAPLAALGLGWLFSPGGMFGWGRKAVVLSLLAATIALILLGNGPWPQYHLPFLVIMAGLAGLGIASALDRMPPVGKGVALAALAAVAAFSTVPPTLTDAANRRLGFDKSVAALQGVLDMSGPEDRYLSVQHLSPVFMMDADPQLFTRLVVCYDKPTLDALAQAIRTRKPRFIMGLNMNIWTADGNYFRFGTEQFPFVAETYVPLDKQGYILGRKP